MLSLTPDIRFLIMTSSNTSRIPGYTGNPYMTQSTHQAPPSAPGGSVILSWTVHLAREYPTKFACSLAITFFAATIGYWAIGLLGAAAVAVVMFGSLADFLFPVRYEITTEGAACKMLLKSAQIRWGSVRHCYLDDFGVKLSPLAYRSRLEAFRGVYLRFGGNQEQVVEAVKSARAGLC